MSIGLGPSRFEEIVKINVEKLSDDLASNATITDYDYWRGLKMLDNEIFHIERNRDPVPFQLIQLRAVLRRARAKLASGGIVAAGPTNTP